jgi:hypothetical protein
MNPKSVRLVERVIGSIRRECLDHFVIFGEARLRRVLTSRADYYNSVRTHLGIAKDALNTGQAKLVAIS